MLWFHLTLSCLVLVSHRSRTSRSMYQCDCTRKTPDIKLNAITSQSPDYLNREPFSDRDAYNAFENEDGHQHEAYDTDYGDIDHSLAEHSDEVTSTSPEKPPFSSHPILVPIRYDDGLDLTVDSNSTTHDVPADPLHLLGRRTDWKLSDVHSDTPPETATGSSIQIHSHQVYVPHVSILNQTDLPYATNVLQRKKYALVANSDTQLSVCFIEDGHSTLLSRTKVAFVSLFLQACADGVRLSASCAGTQCHAVRDNLGLINRFDVPDLSFSTPVQPDCIHVRIAKSWYFDPERSAFRAPLSSPPQLVQIESGTVIGAKVFIEDNECHAVNHMGTWGLIRRHRLRLYCLTCRSQHCKHISLLPKEDKAVSCAKTDMIHICFTALCWAI